MPGKIAVTPRSLSRLGHAAVTLLTDRGSEIVHPAPGVPPSEDDLLRAVPGCIGWLAGVEPISPRAMLGHHFILSDFNTADPDNGRAWLAQRSGGVELDLVRPRTAYGLAAATAGAGQHAMSARQQTSEALTRRRQGETAWTSE